MPNDDLTGQTIRGYELHQSIGAGGFGAVYRAYQSAVRREVAVKVILPQFANQPEFIRRFEAEAQIVARLEHPYIVPLYDFWRDPGGAYLVMRWLSGGSLRSLIRRERLPLTDLARILDQVGAALGLAHRRGVIHLDLKPDNILLDEERNGFLADFGIAKTLNTAGEEDESGESGEERSISGTPTYLAPEQISGAPVTSKADVYSLGIMLYELLIGEPPFPRLTATQLLQKHLYETLPPLSLKRMDLPLAINAVVQKTTAKDPALRYPDAPSVAAAFRQALGEFAPGGAPVTTDHTVAIRRVPTPSPSASRPDSRRASTPPMPARYDAPHEQTVTPDMPLTPPSLRDQDFGGRTVTPADAMRMPSEFDRTVTPADELISPSEFDRTVTPADELMSPSEFDRTVAPADEILQPVMGALDSLDNPYKGLRAFEEADAADFFGREALIEQLGARLGQRDSLARFLAVVGPSGSGKSSVVKAGLIPALRRGLIPDLRTAQGWFVVEMAPGSHPFVELSDSLQRVAMSPLPDLVARLTDNPQGLASAVSELLPVDQTVELLLLIDQFEELFTQPVDPADTWRFLNALQMAIMAADSRLRVIVTLRADFYDRPLLYPGFGELMRKRTEIVLPLAADGVRRAIAQPAEGVGLTLEAGLVDDIMRDIGEQPGALPLLQYALTELFERRQGRRLTRAAYRDSGGVIGALARRADTLYNGLVLADQAIARQIFLRLVTPGEGVEDTRRRALRPELSIAFDSADGDATVEAILSRFGQYRLLTFDRDPITRVPTVEVAHEALIRTWGRLRDWLTADRDDLLIQRRLASAAAEWLTTGREPGFLASDARLTQFEGWARTTSLSLSRDERDYLEASLAERVDKQARDDARKAREAAIARRAQTFGRTAAVLGVVGVLAVIATIVAALQVSQINTQLTVAGQTLTPVPATLTPVALTLAAGNAQIVSAHATGTLVANQIVSVQLAAASINALSGTNQGPGLAILLDIFALKAAYSTQADSALATALDQQYALRRITGHTAPVTAVAVSPDQQFILSGSDDGTVTLSEYQTGALIRILSPKRGHVLGVAFSPDGTLALTGCADNTLQLWDVASGQMKTEIVLGSAAQAISFSPDGTQILVGLAGKTAELWAVQTGKRIRIFEGHTGAVQAVAFAPDGTWLVTASSDNTARIWDVQSGALKFSLNGHQDAVLGVAVSPDGSQILTGSADQTAKLWDATSGQLLQTLSGQASESDSVASVAFSPDGTVILTAGLDGTAAIWDLHATSPRRVLLGQRGSINSALFSPDGQTVITGGADNDVRVWATSGIPGELLGHVGNVNAVAVAPDGKTIYTAGSDGTIRQWDAASDQPLKTFSVKNQAVESLAVAPDGKTLLAGYIDTSIRVWDVATGNMAHLLSGHTGAVRAAAISADGRYLLTGSDDHSAILWDARRGLLLQKVTQGDWITSVAFAPDGHSFLTGSYDGTAKLWDLASGAPQQTFDTHDLADHQPGKVITVAFAANGQSVLTGGTHGLQRWSIANGSVIYDLRQSTVANETVRVLTVSPDSRTIAVVDDSGSARLLVAASGLEVRRWTAHNGGGLAVGFAPDGQSLVTGGADGKARIWEADITGLIGYACSRLVRDSTITDNIDSQTARLIAPIRGTQPICGGG